MDHPTLHKSDEVLPQESDTLRGTLERMYSAYPASGLVALGLRAADGSELEVLVDAGSVLGQLAAAFGSAPEALGRPVELALDLFGFATTRAGESFILTGAAPIPSTFTAEAP